MKALGAALLLVLTAAPLVAAPRRIGWDLGCDSQQVRVGDPEHSWLVLDGFAETDAAGDRAIEGRGGVLVLLGAPSEETTIYVEARTDGRRAPLRASLNQHDLGERTYRRRHDIQAFEVPPNVAVRGVNVLRLDANPSASKRPPRLIVRRIGVGPLRCRGRDPAAIAVADGESLTLSFASLVLQRMEPEAAAPDRLAISFDTRHHETSVSVSCWTRDAVHPVATLSGGIGRRASDFLPLPEGCATAGGLALMGLGPGAAHNVRAELENATGMDWRARVRLQMLALLLLGALVAMAIAVWLRSAGRLEWTAGERPRPPWLDVGWIVFAALVARIVFWVSYPHPGQAGDSYEYLLRAGFLLNGSVSFWGDLEWHSWGHYIRPPGYFALLALLDGASPGGRLTVIGLQLAVSAATAGVTYLLTLPLFGRLAAWSAGLLFAVYLGSITTYSRILAEPMFIFLALSGVAAVAWLVARPSWKLALAAGLFFGLASLFRPGPIYYPPLAGLLLIPALGWRRSLRLTAAMVLGLAAIIAPWSLRNTLLTGVPHGIETVSVANLILAHPDERLVPVAGLDLEKLEVYNAYRARVHHLEANRMTRSKGIHARRILAKAARDPLAHLSLMRSNLAKLLGPVPDPWLRWILDERDTVRVARLTSMLNSQYGLVLVLAAAGFVLFLRRPRCWPVAAWFFFNTSLLIFFFYSVTRYREPTTPVLMAFAGAAVAAIVDRLAARRRSNALEATVVKQPGLS